MQTGTASVLFSCGCSRDRKSRARSLDDDLVPAEFVQLKELSNQETGKKGKTAWFLGIQKFQCSLYISKTA